LRVRRPDCLDLKGVRFLPPPTLFYIPYAFLRLTTRRARRPPWLSSFDSFVRTRALRGLRVWTRYLGFEVSMTLEGLVDLSPIVFSSAYESAEKELVSRIRPEVAVDVGAHLGSFTLLLARYARVVVAVERTRGRGDSRKERLSERVEERHHISVCLLVKRWQGVELQA
jgi:hypothetical protein